MQQEVIGAARAGGRCWHGSRSCTSRRAWSRSRRPVRNQGRQLLSGRAKQHWRASSKQIKKIDRDRDNKHDHQGGQGEGWQRAVKSGGQRRACSQTLTVEASAVGWKAEVFSLQNAVKCQGTGSAKAVDGQGKAAHRQRTGRKMPRFSNMATRAVARVVAWAAADDERPHRALSVSPWLCGNVPVCANSAG